MEKLETGPYGDHVAMTADEKDYARLEPSWGDFAYFLRTGNRFVRSDSRQIVRVNAFSMMQVHQQFEVYHSRFVAGDRSAVIGALSFACGEGFPLPYWLAHEVRTRIQRTFDEPVTLHAAFGLSTLLPEGGKKARNARQKLKARLRLWVAVHKAMSSGAMNLTLALRVALKEGAYPFAITEARRQFVEQERLQRLHLGKTDKHR